LKGPPAFFRSRDNDPPDFAFNYVLDKIAGGRAIFDAYLEFVKSEGQKNTLFYEYAIGDVISEYQLLKKLGY